MGGQKIDLGLFPSISDLRTWITDAKKATAAQMGAGKIEGITEADHQVEMRDGHKITCRVHAPEKKPEGGSPLLVIYHGGGWCIGKLLILGGGCRADT
jgi:acetyl esterase/lipase